MAAAAVTLKVYADEDDALLFWSIPAPIPGCRGFAVQRRRRRDGEAQVAETFLANRTGFANEPAPAPGQGPATKPSTEWPFQRFNWTDHEADTGDTVSYRVMPVLRDLASGRLVPAEAQASGWSPERKLDAAPPGGSPCRAFFNRGFVISQFIARYLAENHLTPARLKAQVGDKADRAIRRFLSGDLRLAMQGQLATAAREGGHVFAALFELSDEELVDALCALKDRAHLVLANGSIEQAKGETAAAARTRDENATARARLLAAGVDVGVRDRFTSPKPLGHNKFLVRADAAGNPLVAWTGSTNWTPTGLCTQLNNGLLIEDPAVARVYLDQWHRLRDAGSTFPKSLVAANGRPTTMGGAGGGPRFTVWFTRAGDAADLDALRAEVAGAKQGILFLMFMPGGSPVLADIAARAAAEPDLYVRGVASDLPKGRDDESSATVQLVEGATRRPLLHLDIIEPQGVAHPFANFAVEVSRKEFKAQVGHAIVHSKVLVIDPFSDEPTVVTGSHNFSSSASAANDENFVIVKGDRALAEAYAVNALAAYAHYRWRAFLGETDKPFNGLRDDDAWQAPKLAAQSRELRFWGV